MMYFVSKIFLIEKFFFLLFDEIKSVAEMKKLRIRVMCTK